MFTFDATEQINEVSRTTRTTTTTQVITRYFGRWPQTKIDHKGSGYLITEEPCILVRLVDDVTHLAVGIDAADHALLPVDGVGQLLLLNQLTSRWCLIVWVKIDD